MSNSDLSNEILIADPSSAWKNCLLKIKENVSQMTYNTWFLPIKPVDLQNSTLKVQIPSQFFWEWIEEHFNDLISNTIKEVLGDNARLTYVISEDLPQADPVDSKLSNQIQTINEKKQKQNFESNINSRYTFNNFIKGEGNQLARAAAGAISDNPGGTSFNPFFVYGGVGLGKTHLIQAVGNEILNKYPDKKVIYLSSDSFTVEFVEAIQSYREALDYQPSKKILSFYLASVYDQYYADREVPLLYYQKFLRDNKDADIKLIEYAESRIKVLKQELHFRPQKANNR